MADLSGKHVLIMATDRFEESELFGPLEMLRGRGAMVSLASLTMDPILGTVHDQPGKTIVPDLLIGDVDADDYDALLLPGGVGNPDRLRMERQAVALVRTFDVTDQQIGHDCLARLVVHCAEDRIHRQRHQRDCRPATAQYLQRTEQFALFEAVGCHDQHMLAA